MYRSASNRPQQLFRQLITSSLTAGSLLFMPLGGVAEIWDSDTELYDSIIMIPQTRYIVENGVTLTSDIPWGWGFFASWGSNYAGLNPNFINKGSINSKVSEDNYGLFVIGGGWFLFR